MQSTLPLIQLMQQPGARAWFTVRGDCDPTQPYSGFNVCHYTGDAPEHIAECRQALADGLGIRPDRLIIPRQTHSTNVLTITSLPVEAESLEAVDALVTNVPGIAIGVNTADCVPVVLIDPINKVIGVAHAGWRGAVNGIVRATVEAMTSLGSSASDIQAAMGPSICVECFEVGEEVATFFNDSCVKREPGRKPHVSLHSHIASELMQCGLPPMNITPFDHALCTRHNSDRYWSARALGISSGRVFTFVKLDE